MCLRDETLAIVFTLCVSCEFCSTHECSIHQSHVLFQQVMDYRNVQIQLWITCILLRISVSCDDRLPVVTVSEGQLQGIELWSRGGRKYFGFLGVPYATVLERFEPSQPYPPWTGLRDASKYGPECPQISLVGSSPTVIGEEQCLFLNIFTLNATLPVIVHIHGGALMTGSGSLYGGAYFLDENVIVVTLNFRLGALGFLSTGDDIIQGNVGLKDQNVALRWVKANIHAFGGDSGRVTIMGESSGAACVGYHILSPSSKNLFHHAIMQSGSALDPTHFDADPLFRAIELAENLDCPTLPTSELAACLREISFRKIVQITFRKWHLDPLVQYPPTIEAPRLGQNKSDLFLVENPLTLLEEGRFNKVPCVIGVTEEEGLLFHSAYILRNKELQRNMNEDWNYVAPITFYYDKQYVPADELNQISRTIRGFYFGNKKIDPQSSRNLTNLYSDRLFNWGVRTTALLQSKLSPVFTYIFGYLGEYSFLQFMYGDLFQEPIAPTHGDDLQYFFNSSRFPPLEEGSRSEQISKVLIRLWTSFAWTGNMMSSLETLKIAWLPVGPEEIRRRQLKWCYIDITTRIISREPFAARMQFWDNISQQLINQQNKATNDEGASLDEKNSKSKEEL